MIQQQRIQQRQPGEPRADGRWVLYWMQQSQRLRYNHALAHASACANRLNVPVLVVFGLTGSYPDAGQSHYRFMLRGLAETARRLRDRGIGFVLRKGNPDDVVLGLARDAACVVMDRGYLRHQRAWRDAVAAASPCPVTEVETDAVIPVAVASDKEEYAAVHLRRKIHRHLDAFLLPLEEVTVKRAWEGELPAGDDPGDSNGLAASAGLSERPQGLLSAAGEIAAAKRLRAFIQHDLQRYAEERNDPSRDRGSHLSPYLHFGQISALDIALQVRRADAPRAAKDAFLEELIVRRELAINFVHYNCDYDRYDALPDWCLRTLDDHRDDKRMYVYSATQLEHAQTHDPYWNAAQKQLLKQGRIHNTMRMYWGKKILEWTTSPEEAFRVALDLNNRYELDGRDPSGFAGVAWCFGKHDRPWRERDIFGKVRYMNDRGLERKFDMEKYLEQVGTGA